VVVFPVFYFFSVLANRLAGKCIS